MQENSLPKGALPPDAKPKTGCLGPSLLIIILVALLLPIIFWIWIAYNKMVKKEEMVKKQWAQVETVYQKRFDLVDNLVSTLKGMANFEKSTLTAVIEARAKATQVQINADHLDPQTFAKFEEAQNQFGSALSRLLVVIERYPELQSVSGFKDLMSQLREIENEILVQRNQYNEVVMNYNQYIRTFPRNLFASWFGFKEKGYFKSSPGAEVAPKVQF